MADTALFALRRVRRALRDAVRRRPPLYAVVRFIKYGPYRGLCDDRARLDLLHRAEAEDWRVLYLGSGGRRQPGMINLDITAETGPDVVGDGFMLPFGRDVFDAIFCESVIEHVPDPERFLAAASQSLKPGGLWYLEVPFLQPFHSEADFQRWTAPGFQDALRRAGLKPVACGTHMGPAFMLQWILKEWIGLLLCFGSTRLFRIWCWLLGFLFSPLLLLDPLLMRLPASAGLACAHYHIAMRPRLDEP